MKDDPTIKRVVKWLSDQHDVGSVEIVNLFAIQSPDTSVLKASNDPVGSDNDATIFTAVGGADLNIVGWGHGGKYQDRDQFIVGELELIGVEMFCLGFTNDGTPKHPSPRNTDLTGELFSFPRDE